MPPMYWSTGIQRATASGDVGSAAFHGSVKRRKYQDESTNVSIVSVSRRAGAPHAGQDTSRHVGWRSSGLPGWSKLTSAGSTTGRSATGTGTTPQRSQCTIGIGQPQ